MYVSSCVHCDLRVNRVWRGTLLLSGGLAGPGIQWPCLGGEAGMVPALSGERDQRTLEQAQAALFLSQPESTLRIFDRCGRQPPLGDRGTSQTTP